MAATPMTGGEALVRSLYTEGVRVIFGLPGVQLYGVMAALRAEPRIRFITTRHEQVALSYGTAVVMVVVYAAYLVYSLTQPGAPSHAGGGRWGARAAMLTLAGATVHGFGPSTQDEGRGQLEGTWLMEVKIVTCPPAPFPRTVRARGSPCSWRSSRFSPDASHAATPR